MQGSIVFSEQWEFYPTQINSCPYMIRFDTAAARLEEEVRAQYPHTMVIRIPFLESMENGYPTGWEFERLNRIEDSFASAGQDFRMVGALTGEGSRRFVFCCGRGTEDLEAAADLLLSEAGELEYGLQLLRDDSFGYFDNVIRPTEYDQNWIYNRRVCDNLRENGDSLELPRTIDFTCYFASEQALDSAAAALCARGYTEQSREPQEGEHMLCLTREEVPTLERITELTVEIIDLLEGTDGYFDGWGCTVVSGSGKGGE